MPLLMPSVNGFWKRSLRSRGEDICISIITQARNPYFYEKWEIPDTIEGRFDCAVLHMCLLLRHLKGPLGQAVFDAFFSYTELTLREVGVSDLKVGKQVKNCAKFFYGALKAYEDGLDGREDLAQAITRNLYGNSTSLWAKEIAEYVKQCDEILKTEDFKEGSVKSVKWPSLA